MTKGSQKGSQKIHVDGLFRLGNPLLELLADARGAKTSVFQIGRGRHVDVQLIHENSQNFLVGLGLLRRLEKIDVVLDAIFALARRGNHDGKVIVEENLPIFFTDRAGTTASRRDAGNVAQRELVIVQMRGGDSLAVIIAESFNDFIELALGLRNDEVCDSFANQLSFLAAGLKNADQLGNFRHRNVALDAVLLLRAADFLALLIGDLAGLEVELDALGDHGFSLESLQMILHFAGDFVLALQHRPVK